MDSVWFEGLHPLRQSGCRLIPDSWRMQMIILLQILARPPLQSRPSRPSVSSSPSLMMVKLIITITDHHLCTLFNISTATSATHPHPRFIHLPLYNHSIAREHTEFQIWGNKLQPFCHQSSLSFFQHLQHHCHLHLCSLGYPAYSHLVSFTNPLAAEASGLVKLTNSHHDKIPPMSVMIKVGICQ